MLAQWRGIMQCLQRFYFDIRNPILTFALSQNRLFWYSKSYFDICTESKYAILTIEILFWHSHWVEIGYFDIRNPILTFALSRNRLFWHSKSYFDIRTESIYVFLTFKILFWYSHWVEIGYFDIQNLILTFALSRNTRLFWHKTKYQNALLIFCLSGWYSASLVCFSCRPTTNISTVYHFKGP